MTTIFVNPDDCHILSATATEAVLRGRIDNDDWTPCVLFIPRPVYLAAMTAWLDHKAGYAERTNGAFCGVGDIAFVGKLRKRNSHHLRADDDTVVNCASYTANTFDIEMEHG